MWVLWVSDEKCNRRGVTALGEECNFGMRVEYTETLRWHKLGVAGDHGRLNGCVLGKGVFAQSILTGFGGDAKARSRGRT